MFKDQPIPRSTPWGYPDGSTIIASGIVRFDTASHGGIWLRMDRNAQVPEKYRQASFGKQGLNGWYEEDCDWCIVALVFEKEWREYCERCGMDADKYIASARQTFDQWIQPKINEANPTGALF